MSARRKGFARKIGVALSFAAGAAALPSCEPIVARPLSSAPTNVCSEHPCSGYEPGSRVGAQCQEGRCLIPGRPEFRYWIVVHVPETSIFAPGMTFVLSSDEFTKVPDPRNRSRCQPPQCLALPPLRQVTGSYRVTQKASQAVGYPLEDETSIPVRVALQPVGPDLSETYPQLPLEPLFVSSTLFEGSNPRVQYARVLPPGRYSRVLFPEPPFDAYFPPVHSAGEVISADEFNDNFTLTEEHLDDVSGKTRLTNVKRAEGLAGWRAWLTDRRSGRRISSIRTLGGTDAWVRLDTSGERVSEDVAGLREDVEVVVAPPENWTAVPRYVSQLFGGIGLAELNYPSIPPPVAVTGVVAEPGEVDGGTVLGYPAIVRFESDGLDVTGSDETNALIRYDASVSTDDRGRFATVLPPGEYQVTIEPAEGTGYAKTKERLVVERGPTAFTLRPPRRSVVKGRALLTDGRPMSEAEVIAVGADPRDPAVPRPRPGRGRTDIDGRFSVELDPGPYVLSVIPKAGTGFPRVVVRPEIPAVPVELPDIRVPAPTRVSFTLRDPNSTGNPIVRAVVRIFAEPGTDAAVEARAPVEPVEIGSAMTSPDGLVEILLAQEPR